MTKRRYLLTWTIPALGLLALGGCSRATGEGPKPRSTVKELTVALETAQQQRNQLQTDVKKLEKSLNEAESVLANTRETRDKLQTQVESLTTSQSNLEARVSELTKSRDDLQTMVGSLIDARGLLEKQVADLTKARNAALENAKAAAMKVEQLNETLTAQTQQMLELQEQMKTIRSVLEQVQQKLE